jgi:ATP-dependent RNA helicase RhlE
MPFASLGLSPNLTKAVREAGYTEPTPIQTKAIPVILQDHDVIGIAQTGTGKTAAFVLPILEHLTARGAKMGRRGMRALIVAPTRELAVQIEENVRNYARHTRLKCATVYGGVGEQPQIRALRAGTEIVIATPGRLIDLMKQGHVDFSMIEAVVLDEADRMLDMGFLPQIRQIMQKVPKERQTMLFSASFSKEIEALTSEFLKNPHILQIGKRANPAEGVTQFVYEVSKSRKTALLMHLLRDAAMDSVLVFSRTKHGADKIARKLEQSGISTATLHSNRSQSQRLHALRGFKSGAVRVLVATDIAARGIDVEGISHVINYDFPPQPEDYVHRIGRTGRAQAIGDAISFVTSEDYGSLRSLEKFISRGIPRKKMEDFDYTEEKEPVSWQPSEGRRPAASGRQDASRSPQHSRPGQTSRPRQTSRPGQHARPAHAPGSSRGARPGAGPSRDSRPGTSSSRDSRPSPGASRHSLPSREGSGRRQAETSSAPRPRRRW